MSIFDFLYRQKELFPKSESLVFSDKELLVTPGNRDYLKINSAGIKLFNVDVMSKLTSGDNRNWDKFEEYFAFIDKIKNNILRLNHLGLGYRVNNIDEELNGYKKYLTEDFELVEEDSGDKINNRWFFVRHKENRSIPKVELIFYFSDKYKYFCPQFQIDVDTDLPYEELNRIVESHLGKGFFFWKYDVPNYGVVMAMGKVGQINGVNILVGLGTNLRKSQTFKTI
jgi:hypothetical protein